MDKRKAYAIAHPLGSSFPGARIRDGHRKRIEHRFLSTLYCDGEAWVARIEYLDYHFNPQALRSVQPANIDRMRQVAERLLIACNCGDGSVEVGQAGATAIEARRAMTSAECVAIHEVDAQATG